MITEFPNQTDLPVEELSYEQALNALEHVIQALESNQPSLDEAIHLYERGQRLIQLCLQQLNQAELKLSQLSKEEPAENSNHI
jgi:exodeoxyribonuclease VII small subunit